MILVKRIIFLLALALCFACQNHDPSEKRRSDQPNIIFIEVDDLTAKYLGVFGNRFANTPHIDSLASRGVVFENAVVQGTSCTPSRNSLITSRYPHELNLYENLDLKQLPKGIWTFPKALRKQGYSTFWVGKNHLIPDARGLWAINVLDYRNKALKVEMGFDDVYQTVGRAMILDIAARQLEEHNCWEENFDSYGDFLFQNDLMTTFISEGYATPSVLDPDNEIMDGHFTTVAIEKLKNFKEDKPFFMWVNFSGPHPPFNAPQNYLDLYTYDQMPVTIDPSCEFFTIPDDLKPELTRKGMTDFNGYRRRYSANIAYMDSQVGRIIDFIDTSGLRENTIIVFFSDHGIMAGDHGILGKSTLFKEVLNPSLIVSYPLYFKTGREHTAIELIDLGKTVLDIAGAKKEILDEVPNGHSLLPLLNGRGVFSGAGLGISEVRSCKSIFNGEFKYIDHPETPILFNLKNDPDETINRIEDEPELATYLKRKLEERIQASETNKGQLNSIN